MPNPRILGREANCIECITCISNKDYRRQIQVQSVLNNRDRFRLIQYLASLAGNLGITGSKMETKTKSQWENFCEYKVLSLLKRQ